MSAAGEPGEISRTDAAPSGEVPAPAGETPAPADAEADAPWQRLDRRTLHVTAAVLTSFSAGICLPVLLGLSSGFWFGDGPRRGIALVFLLTAAVLLVVGGTALEYLSWTHTRYRIGARRVELHQGVVLNTRRSLPRERVRTVDLTANLLLRALGLVKVHIGTGEQSGGDSALELNPVSRAEGERLRRELLGHAPGPAPGTHREGVLATVDLAWIRFAPLSFIAPALGGAAAGAVLQVSDFLGAQGEVIDWVGDLFAGTAVVLMILALALATLIAGVVGSLGLWVEMWWNHRLEREPGGTIRVRRGLLTQRSISLEERRVRGVERVEPLGVRLAGGARLDAVATGLGDAEDVSRIDLKTLLPSAPRAIVDEVAGQVLRQPRTPMAIALTPHPRVARTRRLLWALSGTAVPFAVLVVLGLWLTPVLIMIAVGYAVLAVPVAVLLALDAYRGLGHGLSGDYLVARSGSVRRSTVALQRTGVIGWVVSQSVFQRRAGILTVTATTAAGSGAYAVYDADATEAIAFAAEAVPGLLAPFLVPEEEPDRP
ncbi:PH domain-containing protein [Streptomyces sp. NPDC057638]|uniref:PH domain-containing protein n=1 Tax=Streptomyces sp. NPDC057638 TaxID=3346190 RepID=UPI0036789EE8